MTRVEIMAKAFENVGYPPPAADAYCKEVIMEAIRLAREDAFSEIYHEDQENVGTKPEDRLWIEAARQVVNRMASFDEEKRKDFASLLADLNAEVGFRNESEIREIKKTMVEFLAPQAIGGLMEGGL
jgi:ribosomal protein S12 methylthiotransferase accessory factor YcaO